ncbi:MAG: CHASE2 domain-containing protein, partial [Leptolyngbyaceae cyanobacterium bins.302]|nr:CHASE2 domain-containing protein [Leptolyngbyaceae cyanobacterium bins.302]
MIRREFKPHRARSEPQPVLNHSQSTTQQRRLVLLTALLPGLGAALVAIVLSAFKFWQPLEHAGYNALVQTRAVVFRPRWDARVVVVAIDAASLKQYGRFPWSRSRYSQLLQALEPSLPAAIGFDILFAEPVPEDSALAEAMLNSSNVVLAIGADSEGKSIDVVPALAQVTRQGHVYNSPDQDGISRRSWLYIQQVPSLGMAMLDLHNENVRGAIAQGNSTSLLPLPPAIPGQPEQQTWLNWLDRTEAMPTFSFVDVVQGRVAPEVFANKFVLVGITATGFDPLQTPLNQQAPTAGVYVHAAAIDNLLNQRFLKTLPDLAVWGLLLVLGAATSWMLDKQQTRGRIASVIVILVVWFGAAVSVLHFAHLWMAIAAPLGTVLLSAAAVQLREQHEKQLLMHLFAKHVAPETAQMLWQRKAEIFHDGEL